MAMARGPSRAPGRAARHRRRRRVPGLGLVVAWMMAAGCNPGPTTAASIPPAAAYDMPSNFGGEWRGEVDGEIGMLRIDPLGPGRYRGLYEGESIDLEYVLSLTQDMVPAGTQSIAANRATFTWQDGHGGRGDGWLLINRDGSALTGAFGERGALDRPWTFIRAE